MTHMVTTAPVTSSGPMENSTFVSPICVVPPSSAGSSSGVWFCSASGSSCASVISTHSAGMVSSILRARIHTPAMLPPDRPTAVPMSVPASGSGTTPRSR